MSAPEAQAIICGGFACGKTHIACTKGLVLSAIFPGNHGLIGRFHSTDLEDSTIPVFFDVCPPSWIRSYNKQSKRLVLRNGSDIIFRHLHDAKAATKSRRVGANLGWAMIDQLEECGLEHWNTMLGRVRYSKVPKHFLFATMNPAGHDDFYRLFFPNIEDDLNDLPKGKFFAVRRAHGRLGIAVKSEENRISNGGFVSDDYFDELIRSYDQAWLDRYVYCSFADFSGKVYREYSLTSVHNVRPFSVPEFWPTIVGIDVGGAAPWAIGIGRVDTMGNVVWTHEFYKPSVNVAEVAHWIKLNCAWNGSNTLFVIDPENQLAMLELVDNGIYCQPAIKKVHAGILRTGGYFHVRADVTLPHWYLESQPSEAVERFKKAGSPRTFLFDTLTNARKELDGYLWDPNDNTKPLKKNDHWPDQARYVYMKRPDSATLPKVDKFATLRALDPASAREWEAFDKRVQARMDKKNGRTSLDEVEPELVAFRGGLPSGVNPNEVEW